MMLSTYINPKIFSVTLHHLAVSLGSITLETFAAPQFNTLEPQNSLPISLDVNLTLLLGLNFSSLLFFIGLFGILWNQKNIIIIFLCVELMLFGAGLQFLFHFLFFNYDLGQIYSLLILTVATAETAIGLGVIVLAYRLNRTVSFEAFSILHG
jgi:NADH-quinone oxidoreductase subunit K